MHRSLSRILPLAALIVLSCGDGDNGKDAGEDALDVPGEEDATGDAAADAEDVEEEEWTPPPPCVTPDVACTEEPCHAAPFEITCIGGWIRDSEGNPIPGQGMAACAHGACYFGHVYEDGWFAVPLPGDPLDHVELSFPGTAPRLRPHCKFGILCDGAVHICHTFVLHDAPTSGTAVPEGTLTADVQIEAADGAALVLPAGTEVDMPPEAERWLALSRYPLAEHAPCFVDPADPPVALYAVTPEATYLFEPGTTTMAPAGLDLPNHAGLAADTDVDVYVLGSTYTTHTDLEAGDWVRFAGARVTSDGSRIQTAPGEGIGYLTWFGVYAP